MGGSEGTRGCHRGRGVIERRGTSAYLKEHCNRAKEFCVGGGWQSTPAHGGGAGVGCGSVGASWEARDQTMERWV